MKISLNWLRQFTDIDLSVDELVEKIGAQLGAVEEVIDLGKKYQGIIIARVVSCEKHPNADKLSVCWIDDGGRAKNVERNEQGQVQVVCGAPNVRAGMNVAWLPPGTTVPNSFDKDPFVLEARELRGVVSNGMLASSHELALSDDHNGIVEIDIDTAPGSDFAELYELNDYIIDIENKMFTHRPDCFGILGVAREVAGIQNKAFSSPDWYRAPLDRIKPGKSQLALTVKNNIPELVPRFMAVTMAEVTVKPSPLIIQTYLSRVGLRPINNIVDVTNYLMVLTGQPIHAYDADKLHNNSLETRKSKKGDKLKLLNGKELTFEDDSVILITSGDVPIGVGGVMGGADTEVDQKTKNIVIECANFDMYSIRRTSMKYGLFTDAVTRFNKGQSPLQNDVVLEEAVATTEYVSGAHVASGVFDLKSNERRAMSNEVEVTADFINARLGLDLSANQMKGLLDNVEFSVEVHGATLKITPPYWRTDIEIKEDIVEEIGRLYGFDKLPVELPNRPNKPAERNQLLSFKSRVRDILASSGANEVLTYSFVHGDLLNKTGQDIEKAYKLTNAISPDLQYYRMSLIPSLLDKVRINIKSGIQSFAIFELNKCYNKGHTDQTDKNLPKELEKLAIVVASDNKTQEILGAGYYQAKKYLDNLAQNLGINLRYEIIGSDTQYQTSRPFDLGRSAHVVDIKTGVVLGIIGEFTSTMAKDLKLPTVCAGLEISLLKLQAASLNKPYQLLSKYPSVEQDISLKVPAEVYYQSIYDLLAQELLKIPDSATTLMPLDIYQRDNDTTHKQLTFRYKIASYQKTLKSDEINALLDKAAASAKNKFGAERI